MNNSPGQFDELDVPKGWEVEITHDGDFVRYKYVETSTGECIEGDALASDYTSPGQDIREFLREREERKRLEVAGVTVNQIARRVLEMVGLLHQAGWESLYIDPYLAPTGCYWRYSIGIAFYGLWPQEDSLGSMEDGGPAGSIGGGFDQCLPWCKPTDSTEEFAEKFIVRYLQEATQASVQNHDYVQWYREMLDKTAPSGILVFGRDMGPWYEYAFTWGEPANFRMPMPPGFCNG